MNWTSSGQKRWVLIAVIGWLAVLGFIGFEYMKAADWHWQSSEDHEKNANASDVFDSLKRVEYREVSPDGARTALQYQMKFRPDLYQDYYRDYYPNQSIIAVANHKDNTEQYLFTGDDWTGDPHWIGNDYVFFTAHCGTDCESIYLVNVGSKETLFAIAGWDVSSQDIWETTFRDWFGKTFTFAGMVSGVRSATINNKTYLIFSRESGNDRPLTEKRFLFTGTALKEL